MSILYFRIVNYLCSSLGTLTRISSWRVSANIEFSNSTRESEAAGQHRTHRSLDEDSPESRAVGLSEDAVETSVEVRPRLGRG